jgi:hypothetical protein
MTEIIFTESNLSSLLYNVEIPTNSQIRVISRYLGNEIREGILNR